MAKTSTGYTVDTAARVYKMWHKKTPRELIETPPFFPPKHVFAVGEPLYIVYKSDKWEEDGNYFTYIHEFTSSPALWASTGESLSDEPVTAYERIKATEIVPQFAGGYGRRVKQSGFPMLAQTVSLTYFDGVRKRKLAFKSHKPILSCSVDRDTVIVFGNELLFINGGDTKVLADGIAY